MSRKVPSLVLLSSGVALGAALWLGVCIVNGADAEIEAADARAAQQIIEATGIRGGLIVHLGCGDGRLTAALRVNDSCLVHGLDADPANVTRAREHIRSLGLYGKVSVMEWAEQRLPYADNLVSLLVAEHLVGVPMTEVMRVLTPHGVAYIKANEKWTKTVKPWPKEIDEWTHWLHGPDGNAVGRDRMVGPPRHIQWVAAPLWQRHHDTVPSTSSMVSASGRLFYISDEAPACLDGSVPDKWFLVARDAFSGVLLWKRPIADWGWSQWSAEWNGRFNAPPQLAKRLVAAGDRVFVTLGFNAPLTALDAATGEVTRVYEGTEGTDEILHQNGLLILSVNQEVRKPSQEDKTPIKKSVCVVDADSGQTLWRTGDYTGLRAKFSSAEPFGRLELAVGGDGVFLVDHDAIVCLDLKSGQERWRVARPVFEEHLIMYGIRMSDQCVLVYQDGVVLFAQPEMKKPRSWHTLPGTLHAFRAEDGKALWQHQYGGWAHNWQPDVFVIDGVVWVHEHIDVEFEGHEPTRKDNIPYAVIGLDLKTGELKHRFSTTKIFNVGHHHRCYRGKATERFLLPSRRGVEFLDLATGENHLHHWVRGACLHGIVPCNGLLYTSPHPCDCYIAAKLNGYYALAPRSSEVQLPLENAWGAGDFQPGPAYGQVPEPKVQDQDATDWPTFRHDELRRGATTGQIAQNLRLAWRTSVGGVVSPPVVSGGQVLLASIDEHRVTALDAADGDAIWSFVTGGRVDTPPTVHRGLVLFGSADGWAYCVRQADGQLVWRRRLAPQERLVGAFGQLESAWPAHGSILVKDGVAYSAAGRSSYLDGGIVISALDPLTGNVLKRQVVYSADPATDEMPPGDARTIPGVLADILVSDGSSVYMRQMKVLAEDSGADPHLFSTAGFRDESWFNRTTWTLGGAPTAQLMVFDSQVAYGVAAYSGISRSGFFRPGGKGYTLFAAPWRSRRPSKGAAADEPGAAAGWKTQIPLRVTAMALSGQTLVLAGAPDVAPPQDPFAAFEGRTHGELWLVSATEGKKLAQVRLDRPPVSDGLAVAGGRVYLSTVDGQVVCLERAE